MILSSTHMYTHIYVSIPDWLFPSGHCLLSTSIGEVSSAINSSNIEINGFGRKPKNQDPTSVLQCLSTFSPNSQNDPSVDTRILV